MAWNGEDIYRKHAEGVYRYLFSLCGEADTAEELTQETFCQALKGLGTFRGDCTPGSWLCAIAKRLYFSRCRRENTRPLPQDSRDAQSDPEELLLSREGEARLHRLLHTLPEPYREVFTLRVFAELDFRQLGELFHKSDTWARVTFYRAKVKLQEAIRRDEYEQV